MKRLLFKISAIFVLLVCSCSSGDEMDHGTLSNNPASGTVYGTAFTVNAEGGKAGNISSNGIEGVNIYLTNSTAGCEAPLGFEWPVMIFSPRTVGMHMSNVYVAFKDADSDDFVTVSDVTVEIVSVGETVVGRVSGSSGNNQINGRFEVPYCD